jgi:hypothetical protein
VCSSDLRRLTRAAAAVGPLEARLPDGAAVPVVRIGADYLAGGSSGSVLVPAAAAVAREVEQGRAPELRLDELLVQVLRRWAREASEIDVAAPGTWASGVLTRAASDHIELDGRRGRWVIGWGAIQWIRRVRGG